jgi:hypothetical protein
VWRVCVCVARTRPLPANSNGGNPSSHMCSRAAARSSADRHPSRRAAAWKVCVAAVVHEGAGSQTTLTAWTTAGHTRHVCTVTGVALCAAAAAAAAAPHSGLSVLQCTRRCALLSARCCCARSAAAAAPRRSQHRLRWALLCAPAAVAHCRAELVRRCAEAVARRQVSSVRRVPNSCGCAQRPHCSHSS